jgi:hypothetical protein
VNADCMCHVLSFPDIGRPFRLDAATEAFYGL